jgi:hypothetical protein
MTTGVSFSGSKGVQCIVRLIALTWLDDRAEIDGTEQDSIQ